MDFLAPPTGGGGGQSPFPQGRGWGWVVLSLLAAQAVRRSPGPPYSGPPASPPHEGRGRSLGERGGPTWRTGCIPAFRRAYASGSAPHTFPCAGGSAADVTPSAQHDWQGGRAGARTSRLARGAAVDHQGRRQAPQCARNHGVDGARPDQAPCEEHGRRRQRRGRPATRPPGAIDRAVDQGSGQADGPLAEVAALQAPSWAKPSSSFGVKARAAGGAVPRCPWLSVGFAGSPASEPAATEGA